MLDLEERIQRLQGEHGALVLRLLSCSLRSSRSLLLSRLSAANRGYLLFGSSLFLSSVRFLVAVGDPFFFYFT
jgi:hypothetical protein